MRLRRSASAVLLASYDSVSLASALLALSFFACSLACASLFLCVSHELAPLLVLRFFSVSLTSLLPCLCFAFCARLYTRDHPFAHRTNALRHLGKLSAPPPPALTSLRASHSAPIARLPPFATGPASQALTPYTYPSQSINAYLFIAYLFIIKLRI